MAKLIKLFTASFLVAFSLTACGPSAEQDAAVVQGQLDKLNSPTGDNGTKGGGEQTAGTASTDGPMTQTQSGLKYQDVKVGNGPSPQAGHPVTVHYTGWLTNGQKFDSSRDHGQPFTFNIGQGEVIKGWDEGVASMKVGGRRKLVIPAELGYGSRGAGDAIPPNSTLIFDVELLNVQ